jgi:hypothetical protein
LHKATSLVLAYLENREHEITVQRDADGRIIGLFVGLTSRTDDARLTVTETTEVERF